MSDNGELEDKPPAPPVRMSSTIFSTGGKDPLSANHSLKPLPSVPEEKKPRNKIISIFSGTEKGNSCCYFRSHTWLMVCFLLMSSMVNINRSKKTLKGWRGPAVRITDSSFWVWPRFDSQHTRGSVALSNSNPRTSTASTYSRRTCGAHTYTHTNT